MIGVDTNVLARLFVDDDERQSRSARSFFQLRTADDPAFVSLVVVAELIWLLDRTYHYPKAAIVRALAGLLGSPDFVVERRSLVESAVAIAGSSKRAGIADAMISLLAAGVGCGATMTFDHDAAKAVPGMELLK
jgi:predicted nucleic-acid-binding protein